MHPVEGHSTGLCRSYNIRQKHSVPNSVKAANLGRWFPPWTVTGLTVVLNGSSLVHHYRVFGRSVAHASLRGKYMAKLRSFTAQAEAEARWEAGRLPIWKTQLPAVSDTLRSIRPRGCATINLQFARPVGRCPRSYLKCLLVPRRQ